MIALTMSTSSLARRNFDKLELIEDARSFTSILIEVKILLLGL